MLLFILWKGKMEPAVVGNNERNHTVLMAAGAVESVDIKFKQA